MHAQRLAPRHPRRLHVKPRATADTVHQMGKLIACRACGNQVSSEARACPRCGAPGRRLPGWGIPVAIVFSIVVIAGAVSKDRAAAEPPQQTPSTPTTAPG